MIEQERLQKLDELCMLPAETEWVEFKEARTSFAFNDLGRYFSALCNEANLKNRECGWLVFGVVDKDHTIVGSQFRPHRKDLDSLKQEIAQHTTSGITFTEIYEINHPNGRIVMFQIPAAPRGIPVAWQRLFYGRNGESLVGLGIDEIEAIRRQHRYEDWSAQLCVGATLDDLDPAAIYKARENFKIKNPGRADDLAGWDDLTFLNKAKITRQGRITRSAIILLGKEESAHFLSPGIAQVSWLLKKEDNSDLDYEHFGPPLLLNVDKVFGKIRNLNYRYLADNTLFPTELTKYEPYVLREALNNCIAHQDYTLCGRIQVVEFPDEVLFTNLGSFLPGSVQNVVKQNAPQELYRNPFLAQAMVNCNLIDTQGGGIRRMFSLQMHRYFPLPDYDLSDERRVMVRVVGKVIDEKYTRLLREKTDLDLQTVILLDMVQKGRRISREDALSMRRQMLVEGRYPNLYVAAQVAALTGGKADYIRFRAFNDAAYKTMLLEFLSKFGSATREDVDKLLLPVLSETLDDTQKRTKVRNLLHRMAKIDHAIKNIGNRKLSKWVLVR